MRRKLTITIDPVVYEGLRNVIGPRRISRFIEELVRPHVVDSTLDAAYLDMAENKEREDEFRPRKSHFQAWIEKNPLDVWSDEEP